MATFVSDEVKEAGMIRHGLTHVLGTLSERFDTPMFWSEEDLKWLQGTDLLSPYYIRLV